MLLGEGALAGPLQDHATEARVGGGGGAETRRSDRNHRIQTGGDGLADLGVELVHGAIHVVETRAFGPVGQHHQQAAILQGSEFFREGAIQRNGQRETGGEHAQGQPGAGQKSAQGAAIDLREALKHRFRAPIKQRRPGALPEQPAAQHGRQGERHEGRNHHRRRQRDAKLTKQHAGQSAEKHQRREYGHQRQGRGDHRKKDLANPRLGGDKGLFTPLDAFVDVLDDHDGIVDHQPDGQYQAQQRERVDRESGQVQGKKRPGEGDGNRDHGNQRGAPIAQEKENSRADQQQGHEQGLQHLADAGADIAAGVEADGQFDVRRQVPLDDGQTPIELVGDGDLVGPALGTQHDADRGHAVAAQHRALVTRGDLGVAHVAETHHAIPIALDDALVKHIGIVAETAQGADVQVDAVALDAPRGQFHVGGAKRLADIDRRQPVGRQRVGVQPQAHRVFFIAPDIDLPHAVNRLEAGFEKLVGQGAEFEQAALLAADVEKDDRIAVRIGLRHRGRLGIVRQAPHRRGDPVADVIGGAIEIVAQVELDVHRAATLATHGLHASNTRNRVDLFFESLGDLILDNDRIGAGIAGLNRHQRPLGQRELTHRKLANGDKAEHHDDHRHDDRQHRPANAQLVQAHQPSSAGLRTSTA